MKAIKELSKELTPDEFFNLMVISTTQENREYHTARMFMGGKEFLIGAFAFDETNQGWHYWYNIYERLKK